MSIVFDQVPHSADVALTRYTMVMKVQCVEAPSYNKLSIEVVSGGELASLTVRH